MRIPIIKIFKESYENVLSNKLSWFKVGFAPITLLFFANLSGYILGYIFKLINIENIESIQILFVYPLLILHGIGHFSLWINGYRYGILDEGGNKWWNMPNIHQVSLMLVYTILVGSLVFYFGYIEGFLFDKAISILGLFIFLVVTIFVLYSWFRLSLVAPLISTGIDKPMRESWRLMKGNVLRMWGLTLLILSPALIISGIIIIFIFYASLLPDLYTFLLSKFRYSDIKEFITVFFLYASILIFFILYWAIFTKASSLVYLFLSQNKLRSSQK
ncbi:MAG: hypothetical protein A2X70_05990 [Alphaproteobacteria bacterium GWC2_42_16]|nr:MAG: hypothetical protein A2X70_05990 [Alphaproteobacteria bacterium GWC2_42_16]OFW84552.1 MAG: hypothetical protein A2W06_04025 [Alphaproteobacteria bacterium RBG_16_42_14]OFW84575.1 MAG: hypothetical protein A3E50_02855 [Alphaproteobacteria bacterium RIFCSPHIGHO2_12_FULL_42_100]OFW92599.1 MAG: hypothetical protein A3C41_07500 [Alphaproteobacteria bacterium RIFCSPHIGHO2_02_FULL_42_30]HBG34620.1 hypothetical protein [Holosporales bacterium]